MQVLLVVHVLPDAQLDDDFAAVGIFRIGVGAAGSLRDGKQQGNHDSGAGPGYVLPHGDSPIHADSASRSSNGWIVAELEAKTQRLHSSACSTSRQIQDPPAVLRRIRPTLDDPAFFSVRDHEADDFQPEACRRLKVQGRIDEGELIATVSEFVRQRKCRWVLRNP